MTELSLRLDPSSANVNPAEVWETLITRYIRDLGEAREAERGSIKTGENCEAWVRIMTHARLLYLRYLIDDPRFGALGHVTTLVHEGDNLGFRPMLAEDVKPSELGVPLEQCIDTAMIWEWG